VTYCFPAVLCSRFSFRLSVRQVVSRDAADTIVGNCDSTLFLGGKEKSTLKEISELLGKENTFLRLTDNRN